MVLQEYKGSTTTDMILCKNQIVQVIDSNLDSDWWRVQDGMGRERYYPSQYLKLMTKSKAADPHYNWDLRRLAPDCSIYLRHTQIVKSFKEPTKKVFIFFVPIT